MRKAYLALLVCPLLFLLVGFVSTLGTAGVLFVEFQAIQNTSLNDVVDRIYTNVKDLPLQSLGD